MAVSWVLFGGLTCIAHRQIEEVLSFQNLSFLPSKSKYSQFYGLLSFLYVSFSTCFLLQGIVFRNCWTLLEIVGLTGQGCIMHILTTLQYFILLLYRDKAKVLETIAQVFTPLNQSHFWPALISKVQIYYWIQVFYYT